MNTGYSGTPLAKKLGIDPGKKIQVINAPQDYVSLLGSDSSKQFCKANEVPDIIHLFAAGMKEFLVEMKNIILLAKKHSSLVIWVSWHKKTSKIPTDITEDSIRNYALANGLVDVKVCAVSEIWSGLKLIVPLKLRT